MNTVKRPPVLAAAMPLIPASAKDRALHKGHRMMTLVILCIMENQVTLIYQDRKRECQRNIEEDQQQIFQETLEAQRTYFLRRL